MAARIGTTVEICQLNSFGIEMRLERGVFYSARPPSRSCTLTQNGVDKTPSHATF
jgi:hypothetical protein